MQNESMPQKPLDTRRASAHALGAPVMSFQQVAAALGTTDTTVMKTERRAFVKLRRILARRLGADFFEGEAA